MNRVFFKVWRVNVGRVPVYLLDTNHPDNAQHFRDLTMRVYGGDSTMRVMQEILLGIGGVRLLRKLGVQPSVFHMNEGHAAFLALELIREKMAAGQNLAEALAATKAAMHFHHPHAGRGRPRPVQPGPDGLRLPVVPPAIAHRPSRTVGPGPGGSGKSGGAVLHDGAGAQGCRAPPMA